MRCAERRKANVLEMKCLRSLVVVSRILIIIFIIIKKDWQYKAGEGD